MQKATNVWRKGTDWAIMTPIIRCDANATHLETIDVYLMFRIAKVFFRKPLTELINLIYGTFYCKCKCECATRVS